MTPKSLAIHPASVDSLPPIPLFLSLVSAGFPSPADGHLEKSLNLHELIVKHPAATFFVRVEGESMKDANIHTGDILVIDRALNARHGNIVLAILNGEFTVKRLHLEENRLVLLAENPAYPPLRVEADADFQIWGVVTYVIHRAR